MGGQGADRANAALDLSSSLLKWGGESVKYESVDDVTWFRGQSVAEVLGYKNTARAIQVHVDEEDKMFYENISKHTISEGLTEEEKNAFGADCDITIDEYETPMIRNEKHAIYINESGLYSLILRSKLPAAKAFTRWVTSEVLPAIRRHGKYDRKQEQLRLDQAVEQTRLETQRENLRIQQQLTEQRRLELKIEEFKHNNDRQYRADLGDWSAADVDLTQTVDERDTYGLFLEFMKRGAYEPAAGMCMEHLLYTHFMAFCGITSRRMLNKRGFANAVKSSGGTFGDSGGVVKGLIRTGVPMRECRLICS